METPLIECPIGLFWSPGNELCLKTEYGNNEGRIDAYIVSSGEFFWGAPPQTIESQRQQLVRPVDTDEAIAALTRPTPDGEIGELVGKLRKRAAWQRENRGDMLTYGDPDPELAQTATALETQAADIARLQGLVRKYADHMEAEPSDFELIVAIGTDDEAGIQKAMAKASGSP